MGLFACNMLKSDSIRGEGRSIEPAAVEREKSEEATAIFRAITRKRRGARGPFRMGFVQDAVL